MQIKFSNAEFYLHMGFGADLLKNVVTRDWKLPQSESAHLRNRKTIWPHFSTDQHQIPYAYIDHAIRCWEAI